ncbi:DUF2634 domain-containing protein [Bacillus horti]|uniref:DUF2634 domain-containing protein n=1 Tax=Caldalkalibacillus horti TaxID=77523 RepID=A0ABT9W065_9BACI|nr:DUF2634 domain-containing protein [Bacillus horti]MDQ0166643.1 hypothetical protein [Bacillus horti]
MIPAGGQLRNAQLQEIEQPSLTWKLDLAAKKITGRTDNLDAIKQAVFKVLQTRRFEHLIYSSDYGHELDLLIGDSPLLVQSEMNRLLREAIEQDDRIESVENVQTSVQGENVTVRCTVVTQYGDFDIEQEVERNVSASHL